MIIIRESINIDAKSKEVYAFFNNLKENYITMHPDHEEYRSLNNSLEQDMVMRVKEKIGDETKTYKLHVIKLIPEKIIIYETILAKGAIILEEIETGTRLTEEIHIGINIPIIGKLIDYVFEKLYPGFTNALKKHFQNELLNIKKTLEGDTVSMSTYY